MATRFEQWQRISDETELKAAAAAAYVLGARLERLDVPPAQGMRDFDLVFSDGRREPLEITSYVDRRAYETWERIRRASPLVARTLTRRWVLAVPFSIPASATGFVPYDVKDFVARIEPTLAALETAGHESISLGRLQRDAALAGPLQTLLELRIQDGLSRPPARPSAARRRCAARIASPGPRRSITGRLLEERFVHTVAKYSRHASRPIEVRERGTDAPAACAA